MGTGIRWHLPGRIWTRLFRHDVWNIGIVDAPIATFLTPGPRPPVRWLPEPPRGSFLADPFMVETDAGPVILAEGFTCSAQDGTPGETLHAWYAPDLLGPWTPHAANPIKRDLRSARPAGTSFVHAGRSIAPRRTPRAPTAARSSSTACMDSLPLSWPRRLSSPLSRTGTARIATACTPSRRAATGRRLMESARASCRTSSGVYSGAWRAAGGR